MTKLNDIIQWVGTGFVLAMYAVMNLAPSLTQLVQLCGLLGALCYFIWTVRVKNYAQMTINVVAMTLCVVGLLK